MIGEKLCGFWGGVVGCSVKVGLDGGVVERSAEAEIDDDGGGLVWVACCVDEDVFGFNIAVDYTMAVDVS